MDFKNTFRKFNATRLNEMSKKRCALLRISDKIYHNPGDESRAAIAHSKLVDRRVLRENLI
jgi:hypothetical protein